MFFDYLASMYAPIGKGTSLQANMVMERAQVIVVERWVPK